MWSLLSGTVTSDLCICQAKHSQKDVRSHKSENISSSPPSEGQWTTENVHRHEDTFHRNFLKVVIRYFTLDNRIESKRPSVIAAQEQRLSIEAKTL